MSNRFFKKTTAAWLPFFFLLLSIDAKAFELRNQFQPSATQASSRLIELPNFLQGSVLIGKVKPNSIVIYKERKLLLTSQGDFVIGVGRDAPETIEIKAIEDGVEQTYKIPIAKREYQIQKVDGVPQDTVEPSAEQLARIKKENGLVAAARQQNLALTHFLDHFEWPVKGPISGVYGSQRIYNGIPKTPHFGVDIARPTGYPVKAPAGGKVTLVYPDMFLSGGTLLIDHGHGLSSTFIHLSKIDVKTGDLVRQGQKIGEVGQTGRASGPHLHWAMNWFDERVDPALLVPEMNQ